MPIRGRTASDSYRLRPFVRLAEWSGCHFALPLTVSVRAFHILALSRSSTASNLLVFMAVLPALTAQLCHHQSKFLSDDQPHVRNDPVVVGSQ